jgi:hypothetical protein
LVAQRANGARLYTPSRSTFCCLARFFRLEKTEG